MFTCQTDNIETFITVTLAMKVVLMGVDSGNANVLFEVIGLMTASLVVGFAAEADLSEEVIMKLKRIIAKAMYIFVFFKFSP
jgi:hypothetical protein